MTMRHQGYTLALVAAFIIGFNADVAEARCASSFLSVFPEPGSTLPENGRIVLDGYGTDQDFIRSLPTSNPRLVSGRDVIPLRVAETREGQLRITQAVLVPERQPTIGRRYELRVNGRPALRVWMNNGQAQLIWVIGAADRTPPSWSGNPVVQPSTYRRLGCGPVIFGNVAVNVTDNTDHRLVVRLQREGDSEVRTYEVGIREGVVNIGHGMCSGAFRLEAGVRYRVTLEAIDLAGNVAPAPGGPITLVGPTP